MHTTKYQLLILLELIGYAAIIILCATASAVFVTDWVQNTNHPLASFILEKGPHKIMRRCLLIWSILWLPLILRGIRWKGRDDLGFSPTADTLPRQRLWKDLALGLLIGLLTLGPIFAILFLSGHRMLSPEEERASIGLSALTFTGIALSVSLLEETLCRGVFFRCMSRIWPAWLVALMMSLFFATLHFLGPAKSFVMESNPFLLQATQILKETIQAIPQQEHMALRLINLTLMGCVLCMCVHHTQTLWLAIGMHAAWVWLIKMNRTLTDGNPEAPVTAWFGSKGDATDAGLVSLALGTMLVSSLLFARKKRTG